MISRRTDVEGGFGQLRNPSIVSLMVVGLNIRMLVKWHAVTGRGDVSDDVLAIAPATADRPLNSTKTPVCSRRSGVS